MRNDIGLGLDGGDIRGGFVADYHARILPGQDTPVVRAIAAATGTDRFQKFDVELQPNSAHPWTCTFEGTRQKSSLLTTPNPYVAAVVEDRSYLVYLIDVHTHQVSEISVSTPVERAASDLGNRRLFLASSCDVIAIGEHGMLWKSRRVSLDGITMLTYSDGLVRGVGNELGGGNVIFSINAASGESTGGFDL